jgi:hypothetical protein
MEQIAHPRRLDLSPPSATKVAVERHNSGNGLPS